MRIDLAARIMEVGVKDLVPDLEEADPFAPGVGGLARLAAGSRIHAELAGERERDQPGYTREVVLRGKLDVDGFEVRIEGRADGVVRGPGRVLVEEVKSVALADHVLDGARGDEFPHYAHQLRLYLWLVEQAEEVAVAIEGRLVLVALRGGRRRELAVSYDRLEVEDLLVTRVRELLDEAREIEARLARRRALAPAIAFPFPAYRRGQDRLEAAAEAAFAQGRILLAAAPTGLGKTAAVLTPALRQALTSDRQVYFATSRTTQQRLAGDTFAGLAAKHGDLAGVVLRARDKVCLNHVVLCHPDACEFAREYPMKVRATGALDVLGRGLADAERVRAEAERTRACPFALSLDLTVRADLVVGDLNYVLDPRVALRERFAAGEAKRWLLVVDEAHALIERMREILSPRLDGAALAQAAVHLDGRYDTASLRLRDWLREVEALLVRAGREREEPVRAPDDDVRWRARRYVEDVADLAARLDVVVLDYLLARAERGIPEAEDPVLEVAASFRHLARVLAEGGDEQVALWSDGPHGGTYALLCLDPAREIGRRLGAFHGVVAMSATLKPLDETRAAFGLNPERTDLLELESPFPSERRRVLVVPRIATTFSQRARFYSEAAVVIAEVVSVRRGHYVAYFPSFAYLREVAGRLDLPGVEVLAQSQRLDEAARDALLDPMRRPDGATRLLLAVQGGIFAEGIDLPGEQLVGVIVVSPALPMVSAERQLVREHHDALGGRGFDEAYVRPGMNRVVQAAGRLIRSEHDAGVVVLLDRRFREHTYARYFPGDWAASGAEAVVHKDLPRELRRFWATIDGTAATG